MKKAKRVYVALSGGVDSSVAALRLVQAGYDVTGVYMKPWQPKGFSCLWQKDREDALRVAAALNIPFKTWDVSRSYARHVSRPMVRGYRAGMTPNPDIECNRHIKFGAFYERALRDGAAFIATGHYARISRTKGVYQLRAGLDRSKDQSYFLWRLRAAQLPQILFPVGGLLKSEVRRIAADAGLPTAAKKDSQGVCFVGPMDMKSFLTTAIRPKRGVIVHVDGTVLGEHDGVWYYTIGQRHGLDITTGAGPYYVVGKNIRRNVLVVGPASALMTTTARIRETHWLNGKPPASAVLRARIRYRTPLVPATLHGSRLSFRKPVQAIAPGQSVVFYVGSRVAGGALLR